jgi:DNA-binding IclR family transcriptional regulator
VPKAQRNPYLFQSVDRALRLLEVVSREAEPRTVRELASLLGYERTMTYRLLSTLENRHFVERDPATETYSLGLAATTLANPTAHQAALIRRARPELERLTDELRQTVSLAAGQRGVVIDQIDPPNPIRLVNNINVPLPLHCTSNGKLILARLSEPELASFLRAPLERRAERTITSEQALRAELDRVSADGFASAVDELADGVTGISVELIDTRGEFIGTISVSGPTWQFSREDFPRLAERLRLSARAIFSGDD